MRYCRECGTYLVDRVHHGVSRKYCPTCQRYRYRNPMAAVAGIVLCDQRVLLGRRASGVSEAGKWCIPCGHIEWGEDIRAALCREMKEETGLLVRESRIYAVHSNFHEPTALSVGCWFLCDVIGGTLHAGDDIDDLRYVGMAEVPSLAFPTDVLVMKQLFQEGYIQ